MSEHLLGTTAAALRLGVSAEYVRILERKGKLPAEKTVGGYRIFRSKDVDRLKREREQAKTQKVITNHEG